MFPLFTHSMHPYINRKTDSISSIWNQHGPLKNPCEGSLKNRQCFGSFQNHEVYIVPYRTGMEEV